MLTKVRKLGLPEAPGSVPAIYVASAKDRALRLQKALEPAHSWYEKQLHVQVPIVLALLDPEERQKVSDRVAIPHSFVARGGPGLIVIPASPTGPPPAGHEEGFLQHEPTQFHEDGHILADQLKIWSGNSWVNELVAQMFSVAYIRAERPDLNWVIDELFRTRAAETPPRYTSLADLDYLYSGVGDTNYVWFQQAGLGRLADFLVTDQSFPAVIEKLQKAFPAAEPKQETLEEISAHLEAIRPGFLKEAGSFAGPTTIPRIMPSACPAMTKGSGQTYIVVRNDTDNLLTVTTLDGRSLRVRAHSWQSLQVPVGTSFKLPDGTCLVARDEPALAIIEKQ